LTEKLDKGRDSSPASERQIRLLFSDIYQPTFDCHPEGFSPKDFLI